MVGNGLVRGDVTAVGLHEVAGVSLYVSVEVVNEFIAREKVQILARKWVMIIKQHFKDYPEDSYYQGAPIVLGSLLATGELTKYSYLDLPQPWEYSSWPSRDQ